MKTILGGSRCIADPATLDRAIRDSGFSVTSVITSNSRGVDELAAAWAKRNGIPLQVLLADWSKHGGRADLIRNDQMVALAEACILMWDGFSRGTAHLIEAATHAGLKLHVHRWTPTGVPKSSASSGLIRTLNAKKDAAKKPP